MESTKKLIETIRYFLSEELSTEDFAARYEQIYNFEIDKSSLGTHSKIFEDIFNAVVWYSPYADEESNPSYKNEKEILTFVSEQTKKLGLGRRAK